MKKIYSFLAGRTLLGAMLFAAIMAVSPTCAWAQQNTNVTVTVLDQSNAEPVIGATVSLVGDPTKSTATDVSGVAMLRGVPSNGQLIIRFIGYANQTVAIDGQSALRVSLVPVAVDLEQVVVVGFGTQKKENLTGAVAMVDGETMNKRPITNPASMLQGMAAGVSVTQSLGQPGAEGVNIRIRGEGTFSSAGSNPLILINGVEGSMSNLDPNMIESVSILKDAASASIYGSRAANGVVLVTTKQGSKGKAAISYSGNFGWHQPTKMFDVVNNSVEYMELYNEARTNSGQLGGQYTPEMIDAYRKGNGSEQYPNFDWLGYMFQPAFVQTHNLSASGGSDKVTYNVGLNYVDQNGTLRGFKYNKYNITTDVTAKITDFITIGSYTNLMMGDREQTRQSQDDALLSTLSQAPTYMPWLPDAGDGVRRYTNMAYSHEQHNKNMAAIIDVNAMERNRSYDLNSQIWLDIRLAKGLKWYTKVAARLQESRKQDWRGAPTPLYMYHKDDQGNYVQNGTLDKGGEGFTDTHATTFYTNLYSYLQYDVATNNDHHNFHLMAGYNQEHSEWNDLSAYRKEYPFDLHNINAGGTTGWTNSGNANAWALQSVFGRFKYNYRERYLFEANVRYDGTSRISSENRWGVFPSFSAAWRITEEQFMKNANADWLSSLKLRASWGQLGNQNINSGVDGIGPYPYQALINKVSSYPFDKSSESSAYAQAAYVNRDIRWETTTTANVALDAAFFNNRLTFTFEWYDRVTSGILRSMQVSNLLGLTAPTVNKGEMQNSGFELALGWNDMVGTSKDAFSYNIGVNMSTNQNKLTTFGAREPSGNYLYEEGLPYGGYYMLENIGVFANQAEIDAAPKQFTDNTQPGDLRYRDANGDGKINNDDRVSMDGKFAAFEYSIIFGANWKGIDFSLIGGGVQGKSFYTDGWGVQPFRQGSAPTRDYLAGMWTPESPNGAKNPKLYFDDLGGSKNTRGNSWFLQDASYFRLRNLTLGYTFPSQWMERAKINKLRFYFSAENLFTITKFQGLDPERSGDGRAAQYPQNRVLSFGVNLVF